MTHPTLRRATLGLLASATLAAGLLAATPSMASSRAFDYRMSQLPEHVRADPNYKRIPLDTVSDKQWFYDQTEALFTNKITKEQYVTEGAKRYPGYEASFTQVADFITAK